MLHLSPLNVRTTQSAISSACKCGKTVCLLVLGYVYQFMPYKFLRYLWNSAGSYTGTQMFCLLAISSLTPFNTRSLLGYGASLCLFYSFVRLDCAQVVWCFVMWADPYCKPVLPNAGIYPGSQWSRQGAREPEASFWGMFLVHSSLVRYLW